MPSTDLISALPVESVTFALQWRQELSKHAGGTPRVADLGPELWTARLSAKIPTDRLLQVEAMINRLRGSIGTFYVWDPLVQGPQADPVGATLGMSTVTIDELGTNNASLSLAGLPAGYVITAGDYLAFDTGSAPNVHRCLHQFVEGAVADSMGIIDVSDVVPHIRAGAAEDIVVTLLRPAAEMFILPDSYQSERTGAPYAQISFSALQVP